MVSEVTRKIGAIDCPTCGETLPVRLNGRDTLNISCPWCGCSSYAKAGTQAHEIISGWIRKGSPDEPAEVKSAPVSLHPVPENPKPIPKAPQAAQSIAATIKRGFDLGAL